MRIAIPIANGKLSEHFAHCEEFALIEVDPARKTIVRQEKVTAPGHQPGLLPRWLAERRAEVVIARGMGPRAQSLFAENGISVVVGAAPDTPERLVASYLDGTLQVDENICDH